MTKPCAELIARCFAARTTAHYNHLTTPSYSQHMALGDFYDAIASSADEFAECHMALFGKLSPKDFPPIRLSAGDAVLALTDLRTWIVANREECCEAYEEDAETTEDRDEVDNTELANMIDNILSIIDRTVYKLKFLS